MVPGPPHQPTSLLADGRESPALSSATFLGAAQQARELRPDPGLACAPARAGGQPLCLPRCAANLPARGGQGSRMPSLPPGPGCGPFKGAPVWGRPALEADSGGAPARRAAGTAMASPAIGQRPYRLLLEPEPPRYLQSLSGPELPPPPPPPGHSSRRCAPAPLSTAPGAHERRGARRAARGDPEPQPRASRPARPLRPGLQQRLRRRPGAPRPRDVRSIFEQPQDPRVPAERGEGHCFVELALRGGRGWCDLCGREVWRRALRCANCKFTCHPECRSLIQLDCARQDGASRDRPSPESTLAVTFSQGAHCNRLLRPPQPRSGDPAGQESRVSCLPALSCLCGRTSVSLPCPCRGLASPNPSGGCPSPQARATGRTQSRHTGEPLSRKGRPAGTGSASAEAGAP
ncbi:hypothetical protein R6Z07F_011371 [Ovis aries]